MDDALHDAWTKHGRALEHIQELNAASGRLVWGEPKPYRIAVAYEADAECQVARFVELSPPEPALGAAVGDIAHNLRAALDAAAWQLAIRHDRKGAKAARRLVVFPLTRSEKAFRRHDALSFFDEHVRWVIERLQPYHEPSRRHLEPLRLLSTLATADRHRLVSGRFASLDFSGVSYRPDEGCVASVEDFTRSGAPLVGGAPVACVTIDGAPQADVRVAGEPSLQLVFATSKAQFGPANMIAMYSCVEHVLIRLGLLL